MKKVTSVIGFLGILWSSSAFGADPFAKCSDAENFGRNVVQYIVSAAYNRSECNRSIASEYEVFLNGTVPAYLSSVDTNKLTCLFQGSYEQWIDTMVDEYKDCSGVAGFEVIPRTAIASVAAALFQNLWATAPSYLVTAAAVSEIFDYDAYRSIGVKGETYECEAKIRSQVSGPSQALVSALVASVCAQ